MGDLLLNRRNCGYFKFSTVSNTWFPKVIVGAILFSHTFPAAIYSVFGRLIFSPNFYMLLLMLDLLLPLPTDVYRDIDLFTLVLYF